EFPNIEIVRKIIKFLGLRDDMVEYVEDRPAHDRRYAIDATKIKKELDWEPKYNFDEALRLTVSWYQENIDWWQKLKRSKYFNDYSKYCS
ncbi:MAG: GDP-mannose 4,6-dehydratase, partial [Candidatus Aenigmatarchaeota archaeon]